jgi:hypothetical protein
MVDYNSPVLGSQHASITDISQFKVKLLPAGLFVFCMNWKCFTKQPDKRGGFKQCHSGGGSGGKRRRAFKFGQNVQ